MGVARSGILLSTRRHGETSAIIEFLRQNCGRHARDRARGTSRKIAPIRSRVPVGCLMARTIGKPHRCFYCRALAEPSPTIGDERQMEPRGIECRGQVLVFALPETRAHFYHRIPATENRC